MRLLLGATYTKTEYDDSADNTRSDFRFGLSSNPLKDFVVGLDFETSRLSEEFEVFWSKIPLTYFWRDFSFRFLPGWKVIRLQTLQNGLQKDESFSWGLEVEYFLGWRWSFRAFFNKFSYERNISPLTTDLALAIGYLPETVDAATNLLDHNRGFSLAYDLKRWSFSGEISTFEAEFVDAETRTLSLNIGYKLTRSLFLSFTRGWSRGDTEDGEFEGDFSSLGLSFNL